MKIQNSSSFIAPVGKTDARGAESPVPRSRPGPVDNELQTTSLRQSLQAASDVDIHKVNEVREAIARGELPLDPDVLAEAVLNMHGR